jgi:hypothetical protein
MNSRTFVFLSALLFIALQVHGDIQPILKKDFQRDWLVYEGNQYVPFSESNHQAKTIYFLFNPVTFKGDYLQIDMENDFSVFVNRKLLSVARGRYQIAIDTIGLTNSNEVCIAINCNKPIDRFKLSTAIYSTIAKSNEQEEISLQRKATFFNDFVITATLFLFIFFILMVQLNPRLSADYFSFSKMFTLREADDDQFYLRLNSANILFYVFTSLMLGLFMIITNEYLTLSLDFMMQRTTSFGNALLIWLKSSSLILLALFLKIILVFVVSFLFDITDAAGYHFFNFIRVVLVSITFLAIILIGYFVIHGSQAGFIGLLFKSFGWGMGFYIIILFFKLSNRVRFSPIHLFSYICATEILPFLTIVKILYE